MMMTTATTLVMFFIVLALVIACNQDLHVSSFQLFQLDNNYKNHFQSMATATQRKGTAVGTALSARADKRQDDDDETTLTLQGKIVVNSNPLPTPNKSSTTTDEDLVLVSEFFRTKSYRNLLVTGGGARPCTELSVSTPQQLQQWKEQCRLLGASEPDEQDCILSIVTPGIQFPGLKVESLALVGVRFIEKQEKNDDTVMANDESSKTTTSTTTIPNDNKSMVVPRYEYVGLANEQTASGIPPAVWIFNKLTGGGGTENTKFKSLSTVTYFQNNNNQIVFQINAFLSIGISFPKFLLQILPGDKKTIEGRGGKAILKTLDKDVQQSMKAFEKAYRNHQFAAK